MRLNFFQNFMAHFMVKERVFCGFYKRKLSSDVIILYSSASSGEREHSWNYSWRFSCHWAVTKLHCHYQISCGNSTCYGDHIKQINTFCGQIVIFLQVKKFW